MIFLEPLGLLVLLGIPVLIAVYLLKNKYVESIVPSTYLWQLSERFLKRRNPLSRLAGIISLVLQLLLVSAIALTIAHPVLILEGEAHAYTFVLDGSGSMQTHSGEGTRFDRAKSEIDALIEEATDGSTFSLVLAADTARVVFEHVESKEQARRMLADARCADTEDTLADAITLAQGYFDRDPSTLTYLVTDKTYETAKNLTVLPVGDAASNLALSDVTYTRSGNTVRLTGFATAYGTDKTTTIDAFLGSAKTPAASVELSLTDGVRTPFSLSLTTESFYSLTVRLNGEDALAKDNELTLYHTAGESAHKALIVSELPFFLQAVLESVYDFDVTTVKASEYTPVSGYDLYVFDSYTPFEIPSDGALWLINPVASTANTGFSVQGHYTPDTDVALELSASTTLAERLTAGVVGKDIYVTEYVKCGLYEHFTPLLSHKGNPVVFAGTNGYGNREVVFAFDLHESNLVVTSDFVALAKNLVEYSFPAVLERTDYVAGEKLSVNVVGGTDSIVLTSPSGVVTALPITEAIAEHHLGESGVYRIEVKSGQNVKDYYVFSAFPESERAPAVAESEIALLGEAGQSGIDGRLDNLTVLFVLLALVFSADWVVYCYEKYQLR